MTIQEITALRKSGRLQEALVAAENEFAKNANRYTVGALFWCLNELYRHQEGEEMTATIERMKCLYDDFCEGDEFMMKSLAIAERRLVPHFDTVKNAVEEAKKGGDVNAIHKQIFELYSRGEIDSKLYADLGWLSYYALKATTLSDAYRRKVLLNQYFKLNLDRPSILHSLILGEGIKIEQNTPLQFRIRDFIRIWGLENLREEDWEQYRTNDGNTLPSTVEKLIGVYSKELMTDNVVAPDDFAEIVERALAKFTNNQNMPLFKARVLLSQGKKDEALKYYRDLILRFPSKFYLWNQAADLVDDIDLKIGLLSKALNCGADEGYMGGVRMKMAATLHAKGLMPNARYELDQYRSGYQERGWHLKSEFLALYNQLSSITPSENNNQLYSDYSPIAEDFIYSELPNQFAIKVSDKQIEDKNRPGRKFILWTLRTEGGTLRLKKPAKYGLPPRTPNGAFFTIKVLIDKIVWIKQAASVPNLSWVKEVSGTVQIRKDRNGNSYSIIQGVYVGARMLQRVVDGQQIKVLAIRQDDGRWSAMSIIK